MTDKVMDKFDKIAVIGPCNSGKTSVSFGMAIDLAQCSESILYICNEKKVIGKFPFLRHDDDIGILRKIRMIYVSNSTDFRIFCISFYEIPPSLIVIEDFSSIIDPLNSTNHTDISFLEAALKLLSYLFDLVDNIEKRLNRSIKVVITESSTSPGYIDFLMKKMQCLIHLSSPLLDGRTQLHLKIPSRTELFSHQNHSCTSFQLGYIRFYNHVMSYET